ncbi:MAG: ligand-gated channel protein [Limnobacter sp. CACIAM 66H1]|uniref:TonB-dependent siderophore receptor n=1 Tax=Limnobacter sp. CACIAM 66H1 TaxID=1813033 RepID=UPI0007A86E0E|nr:TonB-dependent siderophore receptor [Limnobacter sp. CACIAM 66H1]KYP12830.1 MAG: ligand-gated channel protein [Limnobacter sp. CACIAM 66H1]
MNPKKILPCAISAIALCWPQLSNAQDAVTLPAVKVEGQVQAEPSPSAPVDGYKANSTFSATKTGTPIVETQQSISVITRDRIEDQGALTLQDALGYTAGVSAGSYGFDNRGDWAFIRGTSFVQYQDGLKQLFGFYNNVRPDPFTLERVEVVKGPSSVLYGQGGFGGLVNMVSKRPQREQAGEVGVQLGEYGRKQLALDLTGPLNEDGTLLYRMIALTRDSDSQVNFVPDDRDLFAPAITWRPNADTSLTAYLNVQRDVSGSSVGFFPIIGTRFEGPNGRIPTNTFISEPGFDLYLAKQTSYGLEFDHRLNDVFTFSQKVKQSDSAVSYNSIYSSFNRGTVGRPTINSDGRTINRVAISQYNVADSFTSDSQLQANWTNGAFENTTIVGVDFQRVALGGADSVGGSAQPIDYLNPQYGNFVAPTQRDLAGTLQRQTGIYAQHQLKYDKRWLGTMGIRRDWAKSQTDNRAATTDDRETSYKASIGYITNVGAMPYLSYSESFLPITTLDFFGRPFKPQQAEQLEAGVKYETPDGRSLFTAAVFEITENNRRVADPAVANNQIQVGEAESKGVELEANHRLSPTVDVLAAYSYTSAKVTADSNANNVGKRLATVPKQLLSVWGRQKFSMLGLPGWQWGAGLRFIDESWDGIDNVRTPSVTLLDAMLSYETGDWRYAVNATNLANREYVSTCLSRGDCFYGVERNVVFSANYRF